MSKKSASKNNRKKREKRKKEKEIKILNQGERVTALNFTCEGVRVEGTLDRVISRTPPELF
jgi:hypothetical protein